MFHIVSCYSVQGVWIGKLVKIYCLISFFTFKNNLFNSWRLRISFNRYKRFIASKKQTLWNWIHTAVKQENSMKSYSFTYLSVTYLTIILLEFKFLDRWIFKTHPYFVKNPQNGENWGKHLFYLEKNEEKFYYFKIWKINEIMYLYNSFLDRRTLTLFHYYHKRSQNGEKLLKSSDLNFLSCRTNLKKFMVVYFVTT